MYTLVRRKFIIVLLLLENNQILAKITKNTIFGRTSSYFDFSQKKIDL